MKLIYCILGKLDRNPPNNLSGTQVSSILCPHPLLFQSLLCLAGPQEQRIISIWGCHGLSLEAAHITTTHILLGRAWPHQTGKETTICSLVEYSRRKKGPSLVNNCQPLLYYPVFHFLKILSYITNRLMK